MDTEQRETDQTVRPTGGECGEAAPGSLLLLLLLLQSRPPSLGLGARLPQRQGEVVGGHPGGAQQRHYVQAQRQEHAQQGDQLEGPEHVHLVHGHLLFSSSISLNPKKKNKREGENGACTGKSGTSSLEVHGGPRAPLATPLTVLCGVQTACEAGGAYTVYIRLKCLFQNKMFRFFFRFTFERSVL